MSVRKKGNFNSDLCYPSGNLREESDVRIFRKNYYQVEAGLKNENEEWREKVSETP